MEMFLSPWKKNPALLETFFTSSEITLLRNRLSNLQPRHLFYCSFENRFAKSGGLAAVAINTLPFLKGIGRFKSVSLISPFYPYIMEREKLADPPIEFQVRYANRVVSAELLHLNVDYSKPQAGVLSEYYLRSDGFFNAKNSLNDPYLYLEGSPEENDKILMENALFFCTAIPAALAAIGVKKDIILHLQEWQTALLSLSSKDAMIEGELESCGTVQTIHNPYDKFISKGDLNKIITVAERQVRINDIIGDGFTALEIGLQLADAPVVTVSENFAHELTSDILQTEYFAPHLQRILRSNHVVGINNGPFIAFSDKFPMREKHKVAEIARIKNVARHALLEILDSYNPPERFGKLTYRDGSILSLPDDVPIFVMSGRLDPCQKGYDILLQALERFAPDEIKAVLSPMPVRLSDLEFFHTVADKRQGDVSVYPIRLEKGYLELQTGATFGIMPSIYEPFGAAIEYMLNGTVNIARRTGGLVDQIDHGENGFLFRERPDHYDLPHIKDYFCAAERVQLRKRNDWALDMVEALYQTLKEAVKLYRQHRDDYHTMILRGFAKAGEFGWVENAAEYSKIYEMVTEV